MPARSRDEQLWLQTSRPSSRADTWAQSSRLTGGPDHSAGKGDKDLRACGVTGRSGGQPLPPAAGARSTGRAGPARLPVPGARRHTPLVCELLPRPHRHAAVSPHVAPTAACRLLPDRAGPDPTQPLQGYWGHLPLARQRRRILVPTDCVTAPPPLGLRGSGEETAL